MSNSLETVLITGGAGFIGSNFIKYFIEKYDQYLIVNLDKLTYAGSLENLAEVENNRRYKFIKGDICNKRIVNSIIAEYDVRSVIHFAAASHVDKSIKNPEHFVKTNVLGTFYLLDAAKNYWMSKGNISKNKPETNRFHHISSDEVFGTLGKTGSFSEESPYGPNSPYSATKASSDMIVRSYNKTYGLNTVITNCSNNYGPKQHDEKFIPTVIRQAIKLRPIPIYGDGLNVRDWLYVTDHCKGIDIAFHKGKQGETYNIGGNNEFDNLTAAKNICDILNEIYPIKETQRRNSGIKRYEELLTFVKDRPGHDRRYAIDSTKIKNELGWMPDETFETGLIKTIQFYLKKYSGTIKK